LEEEGVVLKLCIVDTPGFSDELNREHNLTPIVAYIDKQFEEYMTAERHPGVRGSIPDTRIHAVLYFIAPNGHGNSLINTSKFPLLDDSPGCRGRTKRWRESGLGKTTFMNTLFNTDLKEEILPRNPQTTQTVTIQPSHY
ncbi:Septin-9, partial [Gryganskiella cystojenkinii]